MPRKKELRPEDYSSAFPTRLRDIMNEQGKTQQEVADEIGKTRQAVGYYADGSSSPDWKTLAKLARYFGVSADWLLGTSDVKSLNADIKSVCEYTGLSELAVYWLRSLKEGALNESLFILNTLMESEAIEDLLAYIGEIRNTQRQIQMHGNGIEELNSTQEAALVHAKKILEDAGIKNHQIIENYTLLDYQKSVLIGYFQSMIDIMLFSDIGGLNAAKP